MPGRAAGLERPGPIPAGYEELRSGRSRIVVRAEARRWAESAMESGLTLAAWGEEEQVTTIPAGRGPVLVTRAPVPGPDGRKRWAVRHYRRGGAASVWGDRYLRLGRPRPFRELSASVAVRRRHLPTPAVMAAAVYLDGPIYRGDLVTELVPQARPLAEALDPDPDRRRATLVEVGRLIRRMADAGVHHPDLNAGNVLLGADDELWVVDLDRTRVLDGPHPWAAVSMRRRLLRSLLSSAVVSAADRPSVREALTVP